MEKKNQNPHGTHRAFILALAWGLSSLIIVACSSPVNVMQGIFDEQLAARGQGSFTLRLASETARGRTILPDTPLLSTFDYFRLVFTPTGGDAYAFAAANPGHPGFTPDPFPYGDDIQVVLIAGIYDVTVYAYRGAVVPGQHGARAHYQDVTVDLGLNTAITMRLVLLFGTEPGYFEWTSVPAMTATDLTSAEMIVSDLTTGAGVFTRDLLTVPSGDYQLLPGMYQVRFDLTREGALTDPVSGDALERQALVWYELLHIYAALTSRFALPFTNDHFHNTHNNVTFNMNPAGHQHVFGGAEPVGTQSVEHAGLVALQPVAPGYVFEGWYRTFAAGTPPVFTNPWDVDTDRVLSHTTLYARWTPNELPITILPPDFDVATPDMDALLIFYPITFTRPLTLTQGDVVMVDTLSGITNLTWSIAGVGVFANEAPTNVDFGVAGMTINAGDRSFNAVGRHFVRMEFTYGGRQHSYNLPFNIAPQPAGASH